MSTDNDAELRDQISLIVFDQRYDELSPGGLLPDNIDAVMSLIATHVKQAEVRAHQRGYNTGWQRANRNADGKRFKTAANELRNIAAQFDSIAITIKAAEL